MNNLIVSQNQTLTMSSREIAEFTGKRHDHVMRDIKKMLLDLYPAGAPNFGGTYLSEQNKELPLFNLDRKHTDCLLTGYSAIARMKVIERWHELESSQSPQLPQSFAEALQLAADQAKQLELAAPKVEFVDRFVERESLQNATQVASSLNMKSARALNKALDEIGGVYNGAVKRSRIFTAKFISDGYGDVKQNESGYPQSLFTTKGVTRIHELLVSEGYI
jgi:Rha family phage regulatory protein